MRNAFAQEITRLAAQDDRIILLSGDIGNRLFDSFKEQFPNRFYNCGVAETNMVGVAAGLAMQGFRPFCYTITPFLTYRCMEQIRIDLCYHCLPVTLIGTGGGLSYASLGVTHHSCEEAGMLRLLPNLTILMPGDPWELRACLPPLLTQNGPAYCRIGKKGEPNVHSSLPQFQIGTSLPVLEGNQVMILSMGTILPVAVAAAKMLATEGISTRVVSVPTLKPLNVDFLKETFLQFTLIATLEEHNRSGGLGSAIAEWMSDCPLNPQQLLRIGTDGTFFESVGDQDAAREHFGLTAKHIADAIASRWKTIK